MKYRPFGALRVILALLVLAQHVGHVGPAGMNWGMWGTGSVAVLVFFCLSGFIMTEAAERHYNNRPVAFTANRALRIMPQYLFSLCFATLAILVVQSLRPGFLPNRLVTAPPTDLITMSNLAVNVVMVLPGVGQDDLALIPYVWALRVEVLFYAVVALALGAGILGRTEACAAALFLSMFGYALACIGMAPPILQYGPYFILGTISYFAETRRLKRYYFAIFVVYLICLWTCVTINMPDFYRGKALSLVQLSSQAALFSALIASVLLLAHMRPSGRLKRWDRDLGDLSYPLYLQHFVILILVSAFLPQSYFAMVTAFAAALVAASIANYAVEAPIKSIRDYIRGGDLGQGSARRSGEGVA
ncbi:acyltransferase [Belnapia sp. T6]|uniref:Acyltransferase n=1 Tax=Belnapia mucosa TaxID=2804532 RepID=A0ABS1V627_9PROT|nr:acyltransferase [Belnapia mucosa]MBL6457135.1 acyltransferase [Belnapia mucosa]